MGAFFTLQVYERGGISRVKVYENWGNLSFMYLKGSFIKGILAKYTKGLSFLPKMVYGGLRGRTLGREPSRINFFKYPPWFFAGVCFNPSLSPNL